MTLIKNNIKLLLRCKALILIVLVVGSGKPHRFII